MESRTCLCVSGIVTCSDKGRLTIQKEASDRLLKADNGTRLSVPMNSENRPRDTDRYCHGKGVDPSVRFCDL